MTETEAIFAKARIKGKTRREAAMIAKPDISPSSAGKIGNRLSNNVNVQEVIAKALAKHQATIDKHARNIGAAMDATKVSITGKGDEAFAEVTPDHMTRLAGGDRLVKLLGLDKPTKETDTPVIPAINNEQLLEAIKNGDIAELQRIVFKKDDV